MIFCGECGERIDDGSRFCGSCGHPVAEPGPPSGPPPTVPTEVVPTAAPVPPWRRLLPVVVAVGTVGLGLILLFSTADEGSSPNVSTSNTPVVTDLAATTTLAPATTSAPTTIPPTTTPETAAPPATTAAPPATTAAPPATTAAPPPVDVPPSAPIGAQWVNDGSLPSPDFEWLGGDYVIDLGYVVDLMYGPDGYQIWLAAVTDDSSEFLTVRLDDAVAIDLTERTDTILGSTPCSIDGQPTSGVVGVFLFSDQPQLTESVSVWVIDPAAGRLVPVGGSVVCENEGYGV